MQIRTKSGAFLAALLAMGWAITSPAGATGGVGRALARPIRKNDDSAVESLRKSFELPTMLAWAQGVPRLPAGIRSLPATQNNYDEMRYLEIPVRAKSPFTHGCADKAQIKRTMEQLSSLLKTVQPEVGDLSKGELPEDLIPNLKRIEKLSKELRRQITR